MPFKKRRRYGGKRRKKRKWRQQKLAVGTVQKIARQIATQEDKKQKKKYVHVSDILAPGQTMIHPLSLPPLASWFVSPGQLLSWRLISDLGQKLKDADIVGDLANPTPTLVAQRELELRVHGVQCYGICHGNAGYPARFEVRLIYIPNLNSYTTGAVDYLVPRADMFFRESFGTGNLINRGYNRRNLATTTATGIPVKYTTLARKVINLPGNFSRGTDTLADGSVTQTIRDHREVTKRFQLAHYFKGMGKKAFSRGTQTQLSDGNYFVVWWSDLSGAADTVSVAMSCNLQYSLKQVMGSKYT